MRDKKSWSENGKKLYPLTGTMASTVVLEAGNVNVWLQR